MEPPDHAVLPVPLDSAVCKVLRVFRGHVVPTVRRVPPVVAVPRVLAERLARKEREAHVVRLVCGASQERQVLAVQPV